MGSKLVVTIDWGLNSGAIGGGELVSQDSLQREMCLDLGALMYPRKNNAEPQLSAYNMRGTLKNFLFVSAVGSTIQRLRNRLLHNCSLTINCQGTGPIKEIPIVNTVKI